MNESKFIDKLFETFGGNNEDSFGFITSNMLLVGAKLFSISPKLFDPFQNNNYMAMLRSYISASGDKTNWIDVGLNSLNFLFV